MASSPPFAVEDQTDEDFFDKLVEDEFTVPKSSPGFADSDDSDEVKAFANLSIGEAGTGFEDLGGEGGVEVKEEAGSMDAGAAHLGAHVEESGYLNETQAQQISNSQIPNCRAPQRR